MRAVVRVSSREKMSSNGFAGRLQRSADEPPCGKRKNLTLAELKTMKTTEMEVGDFGQSQVILLAGGTIFGLGCSSV